MKILNELTLPNLIEYYEQEIAKEEKELKFYIESNNSELQFCSKTIEKVIAQNKLILECLIYTHAIKTSSTIVHEYDGRENNSGKQL